MATGSGGSLRIDATIDDSGVNKGLARMGASINKFVSQVSGKLRGVDSSWQTKQQAKIESTTQKYNRQTAAIQQQQTKIDQLKNKLQALTIPGNTPRSMQNMQKETVRLTESTKKLQERFGSLSMQQGLNYAAGASDARIKKADAELERLGKTIRENEERLKFLKKTLAELKTNPKASQEGQRLASQIALVQQQLDTAKMKAEDTLKTLERLSSEKGPTKKVGVFKRLGSAIANVGKETRRADGLLGNVTKKADRFRKKLLAIGATAFVFYHVRRGLIALSRYMYRIAAQNQDFAKSLSLVKTNLLSAFAPIYSAVLPAIIAMMNILARLAAFLAHFFSLIFGASNMSAKALDNQANAISGVGGAAKKAAGQLADFDQIQVLTKNDAGGGGGGGGSAIPVGTFEVSPEMQQAFDAIDAWLKRLWDLALPTRKAIVGLWDALKLVGSFVWDNVKNFYTDFLVPVAAWSLGEGIPRFLNAITQMIYGISWDTITASFRNLCSAAAPLATNVGEGLVWFWENALVPLGQWAIGTLVPTVLDTLAAAVTAINTAAVAAGPVLADFWNNVLVPLGQWTGQAIIDALNWLTTAFNGISTWIAENPETFKWIVNGLISLAAAWVLVNGAITVWNTVSAIASGLIAALTSPITLVIAAIALLILGIWWLIDNWEIVKQAAVDCWNAIVDAWNVACQWFYDNVIHPIEVFFSNMWDAIVKFFEDSWQTIQDTWAIVCQWFQDNIITPLQTAWDTAINAIVTFFTNAWQSIKDCWNAVCTWFQDTIITPLQTAWDNTINAITGFFTDAWQAIKDCWTGVCTWFQENIINPIQTAFASVYNFIIGIINGVVGVVNDMIAGVETGINFIVDGINSIGFDIPPMYAFGQKVWDGASIRPNVSRVSLSRIPLLETAGVPGLATGAVIPPNSEFLAMLGDQKQGNNIEAPEGLIRKIVREETKSGAGGNIQIVFEGELSALARILRPVLKREDERIGTPILTGGDYT